MTPQIRKPVESDMSAILNIINEAFGGGHGREIGGLVSALLVDPSAGPVISLVAEVQGQVIGHILFSCARIGGVHRGVEATILAPLCVAPEHQRRGVGSALIREGMSKSEDAGCDLVFVLGHPGYYPKHGFVPAGVHGFEAPYPIPAQHADAWMVHELREHSIGTIRGPVICADSLMDPKYWRE